MRKDALAAALEEDSSPGVLEQAQIVMTGPLSSVYTQVLQQVLAKDNQTTEAAASPAVGMVMESQAMDQTMMSKLGAAMAANQTPAATPLYAVSRNDLTNETVVEITGMLSKNMQPAETGGALNNTERQQGDFILIVDGTNPTSSGEPGVPEEKLHRLEAALECLVQAHGGRTYKSLKDFVAAL